MWFDQYDLYPQTERIFVFFLTKYLVYNSRKTKLDIYITNI